MSDVNGAAAPAESTAAPSPDPVIAETPNPVATESEGHAPEQEDQGKPEPKPAVKSEPVKVPTTREALQKAAEKVEKDNPTDKAKATDKAAEKPVDKAAPVKSDAPARDETGKFAPKDVKAEPVKPSYTAAEPPARFSADAKATWATAPEPVRAEVARMERELTQGFEKHRASAEAFEQVREFHEMAQKGGTDLKTALTKYVGMENMLRQDPIRGLEEICSNIGVSLRDVAAHVMGQTPEQNATAQDGTIRELKARNDALEQRLARIEGDFTNQKTSATTKEVEAFAAANPRFDELADDIAFFLKTRTNDLSEAYKLAERLNPAPAQAPTAQPAASSAPAIDPPVQTDRGQKSIQGSPSPGSNPIKSKPSNSIKESIRRAMAQAG